MTTTTQWTVTGSTTEEIRLQQTHIGMRARIRAMILTPGAMTLEVSFDYGSNKAGKLYARAEAARLFAQVCDTAGDLEVGSDEPLDVREPKLQLVEGAEVTLTGGDAGTVIAVYFEGATEQLVDLIPGLV